MRVRRYRYTLDGVTHHAHAAANESQCRAVSRSIARRLGVDVHLTHDSHRDTYIAYWYDPKEECYREASVVFGVECLGHCTIVCDLLWCNAVEVRQ